MSKSILEIASANGFLAVSLGAFGAHGLDTLLSADSLETFQTGVEYHMYHALALFGTALLTLHFPDEKLLRVSAYLFLFGILFFFWEPVYIESQWHELAGGYRSDWWQLVPGGLGYSVLVWHLKPVSTLEIGLCTSPSMAIKLNLMTPRVCSSCCSI